MKKTYYKVTKPNLISTYSPIWLRYSLNQTVVAPKGKPIFVFDSLADAQEHAMAGDKIFECVVKNPRKACLYTASHEDYYEYWNIIESARKRKKCINAEVAKKMKYVFSTPAGTVWVNECTLVKEVKRYC